MMSHSSTMDDLINSHDAQKVEQAIVLVDTYLLGSFVFFFFALTVGGVKAAYGRYSSESFGPRVPGIIDWYMHGTSLLSVAYCLWKDPLDVYRKPRNALLLAMFVVHYFQRSFVFALRMDRATIKPIPIVILIMGSGFCLINGFVNARYLTIVADYPLQSVWSTYFVIGSVLWLAGFIGNIWHDGRLLHLKRMSGGKYVIPTGGLFDYVSGANFLCEILEWFGYAVACDFSFPSIAFFIMTVCNIGPRAWHHHQYYLEKFPDYPKNRRAVVPFIF